MEFVLQVLIVYDKLINEATRELKVEARVVVMHEMKVA